MYKIERYANTGNNPRFLHGLKVTPTPPFIDQTILSAKLDSFADFSETDCPFEESYTVFWLHQEATNEQIHFAANWLSASS